MVSTSGLDESRKSAGKATRKKRKPNEKMKKEIQKSLKGSVLAK